MCASIRDFHVRVVRLRKKQRSAGESNGNARVGRWGALKSPAHTAPREFLFRTVGMAIEIEMAILLGLLLTCAARSEMFIYWRIPYAARRATGYRGQ